jgi:RNA polymerase sigma-70 factor (ECF subfamily)
MASAHRTAANELIDRLPTKMRDVLLLRADGVSAEQVAVQLSMSAGAVRVTHHRAVAKLRQLVEESEEHQELFAVA